MGWWQRQQCGILVGDVLHAHQVAALLDMLKDNLVGVPDLQTGKLLASLGGQAAGIIHGDNDRHLRDNG